MADRLTDYAYPDDNKETVDIINLLLLGWVLLGLVVYILGNVIATQIKKKRLKEKQEKPSTDSPETPYAEAPVVKATAAAETETATAAAAVPVVQESSEISVPGSFARDIIVPVCTGDDSEVVDWINNVFSWIYKHRIVSPILEPWLTSLNAKTRLLSTEVAQQVTSAIHSKLNIARSGFQPVSDLISTTSSNTYRSRNHPKHGILVDFQNVLQSSQPPVFSDAVESMGTSNKADVICQAEILDVSFDIQVTQVKEKVKNVFKFILNLERLAGPLNIECHPEDLYFHLHFSEGTQVQLGIEPNPSTPVPEEEYELLHDLICDIASKALASSSADLHFSSFPDCPKYRRIEFSISNALAESLEKEKEEKLLVKVVKAANLGGERGCSNPYCIVEMDEPPQKFETQPVECKNNPFWDESHIFTVKDASAELLFEVYDKNRPPDDNFLGLGIVSIEELMKNPSQRQIIPLQSRPLEKDNVTGSLTTEFLFLGWDLPSPDSCMLGQSQMIMEEESGKIIETNSRVTSRGTIITTTTIKRTKEGSNDNEEEANKLPEQICNDFSRAISDSRQKFLNELISDEPIIDESHNSEFDENIHNSGVENPGDDTTPAKAEEKKCMEEVQDCIAVSDHTKVCNGMHDESCNEMNDKKYTDMLPEKNNAEENMHDSCSKLENKSNENHISITNGEKLVNGCITAGEPGKKHANGDVVHANELHDPTKSSNSNTELAVNSKDIMHDADNDSNNTTPPRVLEETADLSSSTSTLVASMAENDASGLSNALKDSEKHEKSASVSTLVIHSVQKVKRDESGMWQEVAEPESSGTDSLEASPASHPSVDSQSSPHVSLPPSPSVQRNGVDRSRPKEKKSLIKNLRKKLSFRKPRSRSAEQQRVESSPVPLKANNRSVSTERVKGNSGIQDRPSMKPGRSLLAVPGSTRSSFSEASGLSTASSRTYINENSTLVVELNENGIIKRYLIPSSMINRSKWKKKGIKLHLYNEHVFVAKHLSGNTLCQVCKKSLTRRPGKQGYQCRDCNLQCHKSCHVKVADYCPNSSVSSMEVEYVHDPRAGKPKSI